ncbi:MULTISPECIES: FAD-dependent oxidoreductase [Methylosinus]|uniref:FAD-dependent oxidoreductase n=1 Tax=Methylosinus trichosporium (strain ATCC 35070 / NCIMB 11131 / UNIQEM 75 / OB3b) TaxID=595536 RepID=A0A2D2D1N6_METT3|nr:MULTISPECIES: FAD-dependent oxidoreductase [Methylosinus]ATQ68918.1 FAD-dependent oxidoreductase [Methylosinus trichosporium OB3b]OBS52288.1 thiamine biosynthesis protein thio [Methylosinus sp. 3S-1]
MLIRVIGAGVAGLCAAFEIARAGLARSAAVEIVEAAAAPGLGCSFHAGGMIAPWCEAIETEPLVAKLGEEALAFWTQDIPVATVAGTLLVAHERDRGELADLAPRAAHCERLGRERLAALEPALADRFSQALYFAQEAHLSPRAAMRALHERLSAMENVTLRFCAPATAEAPRADWTVDCRGFAARDALEDLRGVKGEMLMLRSEEIELSRPVRLLHPRHPVYIVPRGSGLYMVGATMIENEERSRVTARSLVELINSAFAIHPAFAEAEIVETGSDVRPAFPDNLPRISQRGKILYINGLYRHGFLLAPALARRAAQFIFNGHIYPEVMHADQGERRVDRDRSADAREAAR